MEDSKKASRRKFLKASAAGLTGGAAVASGIVSASQAQVESSPASGPGTTPVTEIETGELTFPNGMPAYYARPAGGGRWPSVVLMHERYGLDEHSRGKTRRCARDGYFALSPNFFFRYPDQAALAAGGDVFYEMSDPEAIELLDVAVNGLRTMEGADPDRAAVAGYCQTGRPPMVYAAESQISAAIVWYGGIQGSEWEVTELQTKALEDIISRLSCPLFGSFGSADFLISVENVQRLRDALETHRKSYEIHIYRNAPHGWLNDTMPGRYREALAQTAWTAQQRFLASVFAGEWPQTGSLWRFESEIPDDYDFSKNVRQ